LINADANRDYDIDSNSCDNRLHCGWIACEWYRRVVLVVL